MRTFIYDYLQDPCQAIADAMQRTRYKIMDDAISEDMIYAELSSPEFRLYEEMILSEDPAPQAREFLWCKLA